MKGMKGEGKICWNVNVCVIPTPSRCQSRSLHTLQCRTAHVAFCKVGIILYLVTSSPLSTCHWLQPYKGLFRTTILQDKLRSHHLVHDSDLRNLQWLRHLRLSAGNWGWGIMKYFSRPSWWPENALKVSFKISAPPEQAEFSQYLLRTSYLMDGDCALAAQITRECGEVHDIRSRRTPQVGIITS